MATRDIDISYQTSGAVEFFLPQLPAWANSSRSAQCHRATAVRYFDFKSLKSSYNFNNAELINFQHTFNVQQRDDVSTFGSHALGPKEEEKLFYQTSEKIRAGRFAFTSPTFPKINLVWIDHLIKKGPGVGGRILLVLYNDAQVSSGYPVWLSLCLSHQELQTWLKNAGLDSLNAKFVTEEFLAPYDESGEVAFGLQFNVSEFFGKDKSMQLFIPAGATVPPEITGKYVLKKIP